MWYSPRAEKCPTLSLQGLVAEVMADIDLGAPCIIRALARSRASQRDAQLSRCPRRYSYHKNHAGLRVAITLATKTTVQQKGCTCYDSATSPCSISLTPQAPQTGDSEPRSPPRQQSCDSFPNLEYAGTDASFSPVLPLHRYASKGDSKPLRTFTRSQEEHCTSLITVYGKHDAVNSVILSLQRSSVS